MIRVELIVKGSVEQYDAEGRLVASSAVQPVQVAGMTAAALTAALAQLGDQLAEVWRDGAQEPPAEGTPEKRKDR